MAVHTLFFYTCRLRLYTPSPNLWRRSCVPSLLSRPTSTATMNSLPSVSSTLPVSVLPQLKRTKSQSPYSLPPEISPFIASHQPPSSGAQVDVTYSTTYSQSYETNSSTHLRDSDLDTSYSSGTFDSYDLSPAPSPSSQSLPVTSMEEEPVVNSPPSEVSPEWFCQWVGPQPSAQVIAKKTCEIVCYLWFSNTLGASKPLSFPHTSRKLYATHSPHEPLAGLSNPSTAALQFTPSPEFVYFMQTLLEITKVKQPVIVIALYYIYRLKETMNEKYIISEVGSEYRVAAVALMLANKYFDE